MEKLIGALLIIYTLLSFNGVKAQQNYDFGFQYNDSIMVLDSLGNQMDFPWVGGLNSVHFQQVDMNLDGILDLLVFEVHGNDIYTFINKGVMGQAKYYYQPSYKSLFPEMTSWVQMVDYNNDGKNDLFTYVSGGISVYKNVSTQSSGLKFQLEHYMLYYQSSSGQLVNIYVSEVDYPAITDIDDDGDVDIVQFYILGATLIYYENYSQQVYNDSEHFNYKISDYCWGKFAENDTTNLVYLNNFCSSKQNLVIDDSSKGPKHTGSTVFVHDMNNDGKKDLLLGDVDYFNINLLTNGATNDSAVFISQNVNFPTSSPIDLVSFPVVSYLDIDNDGVKEMIASPFEATYYKTETVNNVWLYENSGQNNSPNFSLVKKNFMQDQMIDVGDNAMPELVDVDGDGLLDLIIANYGLVDSTYLDPNWYILYSIKVSQLTYYKNVGTSTNPVFKFITSDWMSLSSLKQVAMKPTFGDLDGDGDMDMLLGNTLGTLTYFENSAGYGNPISFAPPVFNYGSIDVGQFSAPELFDVNGDSLLDLTIGSQIGDLAYYQNVGSAYSPSFSLVSSKMGNAEMYSYWYSYNGFSQPEFWRDQNDSLRLFVGSFSGYVFYFKDIENNINGNFKLDSNLLYTDIFDTIYSVVHFMNTGNIMNFVSQGIKSAPLVHDFDSDGYPELLVGNFSGGVNFYKGTQPQSVGISEKVISPSINAQIFPVPTNESVSLMIEAGGTAKSLVINILTSQGQLIKTLKIQPADISTIDVSDLQSGAYLMVIDFTDRSGNLRKATRKLVKI